MGTFDIVLVLGGLCGITMVIGGMILLYKGAISLEAASGGEGFSLDIEKQLKITTQYPAIALFVIGLLFIALALWFSQPDGVSPLTITGKVTASDPSSVSVNIGADSWSFHPSTDGQVHGVIYPNLGVLRVEVVAPGHEIPKVTTTITKNNIASGYADLGRLEFGSVLVKKPQADPAQIQGVHAALPSLAQAGRFD